MSDEEMDNISSDNPDSGTAHRKLRYVELLQEIEELDESNNTGLSSTQKISSILKETSKLHAECSHNDRVKNIDETILDHKVVSGATRVLSKCAQAIDLQLVKYDPNEFCAILLEQLQTDDEDDINFSSLFEAAKLIPEGTYFCSLYSASDFDKQPVVKEKKVREKVAKETAKKKELINVVNQQKKEEEDQIGYIQKILKSVCEKEQKNSLNYYDLVIDTSDFGSTVENIFYCSFLVKEGRVSMYKENDVIKISPRSINQSDSSQSNQEGSEYIKSIDMEFWKKFKREGYLQKYKNK